MKTNIDFGILPSRTTPLGRKSTHASTELVLNNEACVGAAACPRHYCVADVARKSLPPPTHPRHHSPQLPSPPPAVLLKSSTVDASELRDASAPTHIIASFDCPPPQRFIEVAKPPASRSHTQAIPLNENPLCVSASHPQMEILTTQHRKLAAWKTWLTRVGLFLAVALVVICFIYQICAWGSRWHKRRSVYLLKRTPITATTSTQTHLSLVDPDIVNVTICNANPFRGSAIFELPSGSYLYDALTGVRTGTMRVPQFAKELSKQSIATLLTISHHLPDMLRRCTINGVICGPEQFTNVLNLNRLCFRLPLNSSVREVRLLLDPEEFDYLLPNEAVVGFFLTVDDSRDQAISPIMEMKHYERSIDILQPQVDIDDLFVGSQFQTFIQIGFADSPFQQALRTLKSSGGQGSEVSPRSTLRPIFRSVVQVAKPAFSSRMLQLKDDTNIVQRSSRIVKGRLVQQWAYLRLENASAAVVIENLALRLGNLKRDFDNMLQILAELQASHHMTSEVKSSKFDYVETCSSPTGTALNVIVNFTNGFHEDLCDLIENNEHSFLIHKIDCQVKQTNRAGSPSVPSTPSHSSDATETGSILQLYVVQMLFFHLHSMNQQIILLLRRQVSLLSMVNQEIQQQQQQQTSGRVDEMETLECMRCERLLNVGAGGSANSMSCHRVERSLTVNMTRHWTLFKKFNQAIAACTQRLDALMNNLEVTRVANAKHIQVFNKITGGDISDAESATHGLVSLRIKLNTEERPSLAEFVSLNEFASPTSEFLGILTCGLAGLIALITLWRVVEVKRILSQRPFPSSISEDNATSEVETTVNYFKTPSVTT